LQFPQQLSAGYNALPEAEPIARLAFTMLLVAAQPLQQPEEMQCCVQRSFKLEAVRNQRPNPSVQRMSATAVSGDWMLGSGAHSLTSLLSEFAPEPGGELS
jgi:hypothetical protein